SEKGTPEGQEKPLRIRKMSGELVRPVLRPPSRRHPSSAPATPTAPKAVHFDSHLEQIRHFLKVDCPLIVSSDISPTIDSHSHAENPSKADTNVQAATGNLEMLAVNFPQDCASRNIQQVRLDSVWLSNDHKLLKGLVSVRNLAFEKSVVCRFTFDDWKTISEVTAEYSQQSSPSDSLLCYDKFIFEIELSEITNLASK
ncbi:putative phosphatase regulatory subunit-domain-containing protein, partial [Thelonectria olida]